jgi:hypothetical protein
MTASISIVVPVYNEASFIPVALPALIDAMDQTGANYRILIVENGSSDGSACPHFRCQTMEQPSGTDFSKRQVIGWSISTSTTSPRIL